MIVVMAEASCSVSNLDGIFHSDDFIKINKILVELKNKSRKTKSVDDKVFLRLINLLGQPNIQVIDLNLSIIANCCVREHFRNLLLKNNGIENLMLLKNILLPDSIACRLMRLIGNLSNSLTAAEKMCDSEAHNLLLQSLNNNQYNNDTILMTLRAAMKLWQHSSCKETNLVQNYIEILTCHLEKDDVQIQKLTLQALAVVFKQVKLTKENIEIKKGLLTKLIDLSKIEKLKVDTLQCLSVVVVRYFGEIRSYLEGSGIADVFISNMIDKQYLDLAMVKAVRLLSTESGIRAKVRETNLLVHLLNTCVTNESKTLLIQVFYQYRYDEYSLRVLSKHENFVNLLTNSLTRESYSVLMSVADLPDCVPFITSTDNLDIFLKHRKCLGLLHKLVSKTLYLPSVIQSGKVWEFVKRGVHMDSIGSGGCGEGLIVHLLVTGDLSCRENTALAVPFLVQSRNFKLLYKLLARYNVLDTIIKLFRERPLDVRVLASVIRLISIAEINSGGVKPQRQMYVSERRNREFFKHKQEEIKCEEVDGSSVKKKHKDGTTFDDSGVVDEGSLKNENKEVKFEVIEDTVVATVDEDSFKNDQREVITEDSVVVDDVTEEVNIQFDDGSTACVDKNLLSQNSPVLDAMFNGYFLEANQSEIKLQYCSRDALVTLVECLKKKSKAQTDLPVVVHLELLSLTERYMMPYLNDKLTSSLVINEENCNLVCEWLQTAGHSMNFTTLRDRFFTFLFSSEQHLLLVMKDEKLRQQITNVILTDLQQFLKDLL